MRCPPPHSTPSTVFADPSAYIMGGTRDLGVLSRAGEQATVVPCTDDLCSLLKQAQEPQLKWGNLRPTNVIDSLFKKVIAVTLGALRQ